METLDLRFKVFLQSIVVWVEELLGNGTECALTTVGMS